MSEEKHCLTCRYRGMKTGEYLRTKEELLPFYVCENSKHLAKACVTTASACNCYEEVRNECIRNG